MPATQLAGQATNGYRARVVAVRDAVATAVAQRLDAVDLDVGAAALDRQLTAWLDSAVLLTDAGADQVSALAGAYLGVYLRASGVEPLPVPPRAQRQPSRQPLSQAPAGLLWQLGRGAGRERAVATGLAYAVRAARTTVLTSARETLRVGMEAHPRVVGWRRVTSLRTCNRCALATGTVYGPAEPLDTHPSCRCTQEPVLSGLREAVRRQEPTVVAP